MTILKAGFVAALPAVAGFLGGVLGGVISDRLIKAGKSSRWRARRRSCAACCCRPP
jgi:fructose-specific phosphotransferase system IIC component